MANFRDAKLAAKSYVNLTESVLRLFLQRKISFYSKNP